MVSKEMFPKMDSANNENYEWTLVAKANGK